MRALALVVALSSASAFAAEAYWTGRSKYVTTVTCKTVLSCEYNYLGTKFWRMTNDFACPSSVEVE